jgi:hypothetical protein
MKRENGAVVQNLKNLSRLFAMLPTSSPYSTSMALL